LGWAVGGWESCRLTADPSGKVTAQLGMSGQGQAHETIFAQIISDALGVNFEDVRVMEGDTQQAPDGRGAGACGAPEARERARGRRRDGLLQLVEVFHS